MGITSAPPPLIPGATFLGLGKGCGRSSLAPASAPPPLIPGAPFLGLGKGCGRSSLAPVSAPPLSYSCTQRTGKPFERLSPFSGPTPEPSKPKPDPYTLDAEEGELLQA